MKHNVRINGEVREMDFELGSGLVDINGQEIFEGDILRSSYRKNAPNAPKYVVKFRNGGLKADTLYNLINAISLSKLEVVGHVDD